MFYKKKKYNLLYIILMILIFPFTCNAQSIGKDSIYCKVKNKSISFYDSLQVKANRKKLTRLLHDLIVTGYKPTSDSISETHSYYSKAQGKIIGDIEIIRLPVFGPTIQDTTLKPKSWLEKAGNTIHTRSDLHNLRKNLIIKPGQVIDAEALYENERIFRTLPRIRDARFEFRSDSISSDTVDLILITQDRFSIGVTGFLDGSSAAAELYNSNFFGLGHQASLRLVGHLRRQPYLGFESFYKIDNLDGKFLSLEAGYSNTFRNEGVIFNFEKPLIRPVDSWAYGGHAFSYKRTSELQGLIRPFRDINLRYNELNFWAARNLQLYSNNNIHSQITVSANFLKRQFKERPFPPPGELQYFYNTNFYLTGISWSQRWYIPDKLIYGYGITEDIPKGFKNEFVFGYEDNENGERFYSHIFLSNGNFLRKTPGYLYVYGGAGTYFNYRNPQQGHVEAGLNFISRLHGNGPRFRHFIKVDYLKGFNRFDVENLYFQKNDLIRGFESRQIFGKERLNFNFESVYFQQRDVYRFNVAFFTFLDIGMLGDDHKLIFKERYYWGFGAGMRLHNEALVLKTIMVRLSIYPNHPKDLGLLGLLIVEQTRQNFYNFRPGPPEPKRFQ